MAKPGDIFKAFEQAIKKVFSAQSQQAIANEMADSVRIRAQLGGSVENTGSKKKAFKALSDSYKQQRKKFSGLSDKTTPNKSNITRTGQMIESIRGKGKANGFLLELAGSRDDGLTNEKVAGFVEEQGRPFMNLSDIELKKLARLLEENLADEINKILGK